MSEVSKLTVDELLRLYVETPREDFCAEYLDLLIEKYALAVIEKCLRAKVSESVINGFFVSPTDFEDLQSESCLKLVEKLAAMRQAAKGNSIQNFNSYTATIAYNVWNSFFNDAAPNRKALKNKIRYAIERDEKIEVWRENKEIYYKLFSHERKLGKISTEDLTNRIMEEYADFRNADLSDLVFKILEKADSVLKLNEIVTIAAKLQAIEDVPDLPFDEFRENRFSANGQSDFEMRFDLAKLWKEICELPVNQRIALLYNLRDDSGREMLFMFFNAKIASLREIGKAMNLSLEDCAKILPLLPLEDKAIAERMKLTAKQVSNLRKVARENLRRRLAGKPKRRQMQGQNEEDYFARETHETYEKKR